MTYFSTRKEMYRKLNLYDCIVVLSLLFVTICRFSTKEAFSLLVPFCLRPEIQKNDERSAGLPVLYTSFPPLLPIFFSISTPPLLSVDGFCVVSISICRTHILRRGYCIREMMVEIVYDPLYQFTYIYVHTYLFLLRHDFFLICASSNTVCDA